MSSLTDKSYRYRNAEMSRKPGYLAKRFADMKREYAKAWDEAHAENDARNAEVRKSVVRQLGRQK